MRFVMGRHQAMHISKSLGVWPLFILARESCKLELRNAYFLFTLMVLRDTSFDVHILRKQWKVKMLSLMKTLIYLRLIRYKDKCT